MAKRKIATFLEIQNENEFQQALELYSDRLICADIYSYFTGPCSALDRLFITMKLDWSDGQMVLLKVPADAIEALQRFRGQSEPVFMFILNKKVTRVFRGVNSLKLADVAKQELHYFKSAEGVGCRPTYEIGQATPDEAEWIQKISIQTEEEIAIMNAKRTARQAARKRHRAELMVPFLRHLNFVLFWPHCVHAHPELYEKWDINNIIMVAREEIQLNEETARDVLYNGDAPLNEASIYQLISGPALAICFRLLDTDKHFVSLVRKVLYEDIPTYDDNRPAEELSRKTAYKHYLTYSLTREDVLERRRLEKIKRKEEIEEQRARRLSEMQRLARQAIEEAIEARTVKREQRRIELLKSGNLSALDEFDREPEEDIDIEIPRQLSDDYIEESSDDDADFYLPPPGLPIPGFYAPPNDVAKANGLATLFPKIVAENVTPEPEFLPPHVLVLLEIWKRYKAIEALAPYKNYIIHMGVFKASSPYHNTHLAYSVRQYDTLDTNSLNQEDIMLAFMLSMERDLPLLELMDLSPHHVSRDTTVGDDECDAMFPQEYGDSREFEDFDNIAQDIN